MKEEAHKIAWEILRDIDKMDIPNDQRERLTNDIIVLLTTIDNLYEMLQCSESLTRIALRPLIQ